MKGSSKVMAYAGLVVALVAMVGLAVVIVARSKGVGGGLGSNRYVSSECGVEFEYPKNWVRSDIKLSLSQEPLAQVVFDEMVGGVVEKRSLFSLFCYDASKYSFEQFFGGDVIGKEMRGAVTTESLKWERVGNFAYTIKGDRLLIVQMFFTKFDLKPQNGYEQTFMSILNSMR
ncbi:MAG: hypothetical protein BWY29_00448 [Microgenomates group bacterium ADurb.Bin238]|jgi:hypothetical protein|uniref:Uncharacterized protein n=1 Tax=Candidatus Chazhemtobacterium aquaticus TaxID=2715735 RepID=A0A857N6Y4_9BACT|nr:hypothetical protein [Candidatus Chazhemtobacterium aquaticus]OQA83234.1 MAG: hypothetical protein BWY29_00448 [Microgenomates group bacterium ADurb.Bin238]QHO63093.1 hypothetical protein MICH65_0112 [Candidatus Chazhemtobacterium aquaticus]